MAIVWRIGKMKLRDKVMGFRDKVLKVVGKIPKGKVLTYKEVAELAMKPRAWRAVGNVLNKNRDKNVPCHRVIRSGGKIGGYRRGTKMKMTLLRKEGIFIGKNGKT